MHEEAAGPMTSPGDLAAMARLLRAGAIDAELAALLWLLLDSRTPVVAIGPPSAGCDVVVGALAGLLPPETRLVAVAPDDEFAWLPEAWDLGWRPEHHDSKEAGRDPVAPSVHAGDGVLVVRGLGLPGGVAGSRARVVVRALALGYGMLATMAGDGLEDALEILHDPAIGTDADERSRLGVVLAVEPGDGGPRVGAAHYVRPVALDTSGHVQRQPPAVLATWNRGAGRWDHFAWGILADLGGRTGMRPAGFEREQARRAAALRDESTRSG
jgi:hypothetical protein